MADSLPTNSLDLEMEVSSSMKAPAKKESMQTAQEKSKRKKELLTRRAAQLFLKHGYEKTTTNDIAKAIGVKGPSVYHYFKSKEEIVLAIFHKVDEIFEEKIIKEAQKAANSEEKLRVIVRNSLESIFKLGGEFPFLMFDQPPVKKYAANRKKKSRRVVNFARGIIEDIVRERDLKDPIDSTVAVYSLIALSVWPYKWFNPKGKMSLEELADSITRFFLQGLCGKEVALPKHPDS
jgi:TetR/AcrR family transcriptional regulator, cholesterol catabolism regulator